jgi:hypothetical protein
MLFVVACGEAAHAPRPVADARPAAAGSPLLRLASLHTELADVSVEGRCQVELTTADGELVARLDEESHARLVGAEDFDVEVVHRYDNRFQRGAADSMRAVKGGGVLAVRRQGEPFARVPNLHGEAARYREAGLGLFPALVRAFASEARRTGDHLQLVLVSPGAAPADAPLLNDRDWAPAFHANLANVAGSGDLTWPELAAHPSEGKLQVSAALNGHALRAECRFEVSPLPRGTRLELPSPLVNLERPRVQRDLDDVMRRLSPPAPVAQP